jgi:CBS domain containing-hemolysin-like protein
VTLVALLIAAVLVVVTGLLRAAGASLVRTPRADAVRKAAEGNRAAEIVAELLDDRARLQPALGMVHTALLVAALLSAGWALTRSFDGIALVVALIVLGVVLLLVGEVLPRSLGRWRSGTLAYHFARLLRVAFTLGAAAADLIPDEEGEPPEDAELEDEADQEERTLISSVLEFTDTLVREVMTPRTDMVSIHGAASTDLALDLVLEAGRSRIPVLGESADDILGVLYARDLLKLMDDEAAAVPAREIMRPAYFVPETKRVSELLRDMQSNQVHMAIVVDEFGGTAGIVTIEDLLEEIVGEIVDEYDREEPMVTPIEGGFLVDGRLGIDELGELLGVDLPNDEWDTVGGLVLRFAGRVPHEGERFEIDDHLIVVDRVQGRRVARVRLAPR